jgi:hypothetical protein
MRCPLRHTARAVKLFLRSVYKANENSVARYRSTSLVVADKIRSNPIRCRLSQAILTQTSVINAENFFHTIGFKENANYFRRILAKIVQISDRNIEPRFYFRNLGLTPGHRDQLGRGREQDHPDGHRFRPQVHPPRHREERARIGSHRKAGKGHLPAGFHFLLLLLLLWTANSVSSGKVRPQVGPLAIGPELRKELCHHRSPTMRAHFLAVVDFLEKHCYD